MLGMTAGEILREIQLAELGMSFINPIEGYEDIIMNYPDDTLAVQEAYCNLPEYKRDSIRIDIVHQFETKPNKPINQQRMINHIVNMPSSDDVERTEEIIKMIDLFHEKTGAMNSILLDRKVHHLIYINRDNEAMNIIKEAVRLFPNDVTLLDQQFHMLVKQENYIEAEKLITQLESLTKTSTTFYSRCTHHFPTVYYKLYQVEKEQNNKDKAYEYLKLAYKYDDTRYLGSDGFAIRTALLKDYTDKSDVYQTLCSHDNYLHPDNIELPEDAVKALFNEISSSKIEFLNFPKLNDREVDSLALAIKCNANIAELAYSAQNKEQFDTLMIAGKNVITWRFNFKSFNFEQIQNIKTEAKKHFEENKFILSLDTDFAGQFSRYDLYNEFAGAISSGALKSIFHIKEEHMYWFLCKNRSEIEANSENGKAFNDEIDYRMTVLVGACLYRFPLPMDIINCITCHFDMREKFWSIDNQFPMIKDTPFYDVSRFG